MLPVNAIFKLRSDEPSAGESDQERVRNERATTDEGPKEIVKMSDGLTVAKPMGCANL